MSFLIAAQANKAIKEENEKLESKLSGKQIQIQSK